MMKRRLLIFAMLLLGLLPLAGRQSSDSLSVWEGRRGPDRVFMPKGDISVGIQFFYLDLASSNSEILLLLQHLDAAGSVTSISPYFDYAYRDNRSVGIRSKYVAASGSVSNVDLSLLSDGLEMSLQDLSANSRTIQSELYHRTYAPLDEKGRFGVFTDLALSWSRTNTSFNCNAETLGTRTVNDKLRLAVHPGLMIFVLNNLSTHVSIGIGGANYSRTDYIEDGEVKGRRYSSKVNFMIDILDISYGLCLHF